jgi:hypothetical protein
MSVVESDRVMGRSAGGSEDFGKLRRIESSLPTYLTFERTLPGTNTVEYI